MLHDFYEYQNGVRPKSVSATYLILGHASAAGRSSNHDIEMSSSMPESEDVYNAASARILTLVKEEALSGLYLVHFMVPWITDIFTATLQLYQNVTSIHIYSLAPSSVNDLSYLVDETKSLRVETSSGLEQQKTFEKLGVIFNPHLRLREQKGQTVSNAPATFKAPSKGMFQKDKMKAEAIETPFKGPASTPTASGKNVKRDFAGAIHKSFAKSVMKPSVKKKAAIKEDEHETALSSDGEADDSDIMPSANAKQPDSRTKSRKEREDELRRMMEEDAKDNSGEDNSSDSSEKDPALSDTHKEDQQAPAVSEQPEAKMSAEAEVSEVVSSTGDGRRRGKRRVMKKKRILDDHGYMGTFPFSKIFVFSVRASGNPYRGWVLFHVFPSAD